MTEDKNARRSRLYGPTPRQLAYFKEVASHLNFRSAAAVLSLSQPALTSAIQELESVVGAKLFDRGTRSVQLTASGKAIRPQIEWMLSNYLLGVQGIEQMLQRGEDMVRIAYVPAAAQLAALSIMQWQRARPMAMLHWTDMSDDLLATAVENGEVDIGLGLGFTASEALETQLIAQEQIVALVGVRHPLAKAQPLQWIELRDHPLVMLSHNNHQQMIMHSMEQSDADTAFVKSVSHIESLYAMVETGMFVGLVSSLYEASYLARGFVTLKAQSPALSRYVSLATRKCTPGTRRPIVQDCWEYLCMHMKKVA